MRRPKDELSKLIGFFMQSHGNLSVLLRPVTSQPHKDLAERAMWLGPVLPLDLSVLDGISPTASPATVQQQQPPLSDPSSPKGSRLRLPTDSSAASPAAGPSGASSPREDLTSSMKILSPRTQLEYAIV